MIGALPRQIPISPQTPTLHPEVIRNLKIYAPMIVTDENIEGEEVEPIRIEDKRKLQINHRLIERRSRIERALGIHILRPGEIHSIPDAKLQRGSRFWLRRKELANLLQPFQEGRSGKYGFIAEGYDEEEDVPVIFKFANAGFTLDRIAGLHVRSLHNEAKLLKEIDHPNIIKLYQMTEFVLSNGVHIPAIILEKADGDVRDLIETSQDKEERIRLAADIAEQIGSAIDYLGENNIAHRDIKPANILYKEQNGERVYLLSDFGLSIDNDDTNGSIPLNTPRAIAAPEQYSGVADRLIEGKRVIHDTKSDQYGLAITIYLFMLGIANDERLALFIKDGTNKDFQIPGSKLSNLGIPDRVFEVIQKATSYKPEDRYKTSAEFAAELRIAINTLN